jgi:predicted patatin/cPLA2 family phospholipase
LRTSSASSEKQSIPDYFGEVYYKNHPGLTQIFSKSYLRFNAAIEYISNPPEGVKINQIMPTEKLKTGMYTNSKTALEMDYRYGLEAGLDYLKALKKS